MPYLSSVSFLCHQHWRSRESIKKIPAKTPLLMISGLKDEVVPPPHMKALWEIATSGIDGEEVELEEEGDGIFKKEKKDGEEKAEAGAGHKKYRRVRKGTRWWMEFTDGVHSESWILAIRARSIKRDSFCSHRQHMHASRVLVGGSPVRGWIQQGCMTCLLGCPASW